MTEIKTAFIREFARLRRGPGLNGDRLHQRIGPHIGMLCDLAPEADDPEIRRKVAATVERLAAPLPGAGQLVVKIALGIEPGVRLRWLHDRVDVLARRLYCEERSARRHIDRAFEWLADEAAAYIEALDAPDKGWHVRRIEALLRLDGPAPELIEKRTIAATRANLKRISGRFSLPRAASGVAGPMHLEADVQQGARLASWNRQGEAHFRFVLDLPAALTANEEHTYTIVFRLPAGQPMQPHLAFVPLVGCDVFHLRIRFDLGNAPASVWRLDHLPPRALDDWSAMGAELDLDEAGEIMLAFDRMDNGFGYGAAWNQ